MIPLDNYNKGEVLITVALIAVNNLTLFILVVLT